MSRGPRSWAAVWTARMTRSAKSSGRATGPSPCRARASNATAGRSTLVRSGRRPGESVGDDEQVPIGAGSSQAEVVEEMGVVTTFRLPAESADLETGDLGEDVVRKAFTHGEFADQGRPGPGGVHALMSHLSLTQRVSAPRCSFCAR